MDVLDALRKNIQTNITEHDRVVAQMKGLVDTAQSEGRSNLNVVEDARFDAWNAEAIALNETIEAQRGREAELIEAMQRRDNARLSPVHDMMSEPVRRRGVPTGSDERSVAIRNVESEWRLPDSIRSAAIDVLEAKDSGTYAGLAAVLSDTDYTTAWLKTVRDPMRGHLEWTPREHSAFNKVRDVQRAMAVGTGSAGGYMVPFVLDPTIIITGAGSINPMRKLATIKRVPAGNWHGITGGQVSASWDTEASAVSDDTPTLTQPSIPSFLGRVFIPASFEAVQDIADLANDVATLFADAKDNLEATTHATSAGSGSPTGVVYAVGAITASRVSPGTGGTYALTDAFALQSALPARHSHKASWGSSITVINKARQLAMAQNSANSVWTDVGEGATANFLGRGYNEFSAMSATLTTGQDVLLYGDFSKYYITDVIGSPTLEYIPNLFDTSTGRPTSQRGFMLWWREGGNVVDADAFRLLRL